MDKLKKLEKEYKRLLDKKYALAHEMENIRVQIEQEKYPTGEYEKILGKLFDLSNIVPIPDDYKVFKYYCLPFEIISCEDCYVNLNAKILLYKINQKGVVMNMVCNYDMRVKKSGFYDDFFNDKNIVANPEDEVKEILNQGVRQFLTAD